MAPMFSVDSLRVDAAAELGEQRHEAGPEAEADDEEGGDGVRIAQQFAVDQEDAGDAQEAEGDDEEAGYGAAAQGDGDRLAQGARGSGGGAAGGTHGGI